MYLPYVGHMHMFLVFASPCIAGSTFSSLQGSSTTAGGPLDGESSELHLPKVSYPLLRIPWGVMVLEKTGLCRCGGKVKWRRRM